MPAKKLAADWSDMLLEELTLEDDAEETSRLQPIVESKAQLSQSEPIYLDETFLASDDLFDLTHEQWQKYNLWLYQNVLYGVIKGHTQAQDRLLILEKSDQERQKFERLTAKFSSERTEHIKYERTRIPENVRIEVWRRDQGKCAGCGSRENLEYDHIVPVSRGGSNTARNVELLCETCNRAKGNRIQ